MKSIIIAEKSSAKKNILAAIGEQYGEVFAASGHLYCLADPERTGDEFKNWRSFSTIRPDKWVKVPTVSQRREEQSRLNQLRADIAGALKKADRVYIATDCDREGELIGREILDYHDYKGEVMRVIFASEDVETLKVAFSNAVPIEKRETIYQAALARERADSIWNLSLTRAATSALIPTDHQGVIGLGRVKTPTHAIVCRRELQIIGFKADNSYSIRVRIETPAGEFELSIPKEAVYNNEDEAKAVANRIVEAGPLKLEATTKEGKRSPPKPPSLGNLQIAAGRWGWSAAKTLEIGQELYSTAKVMTYVRAATCFYPEAMIADIPNIVAGLKQIDDLAALIPELPVIRQGNGGFFSDEALKGESHHALAPNARTIGEIKEQFLNLKEDEKKLFLYMAKLFIQAVSADEEYTSYAFIGKVPGDDMPPLTASGRKINKPGWNISISDSPEEEAENIETELVSVFPQAGEYRIISAVPFKRASSPPKRYTQGTLIKAMMDAWRFVPDKALRERLKEAKGIGTEATRANVIEGLIAQNMIADDKTIKPTDAGMKLFVTLHEIDPVLVDPGTTAIWENKIDEIAAGKESEKDFVDQIEVETRRLVSLIQKCPANPIFGEPYPPTEKMVKAIEAISKNGPKPPSGWRYDGTIAKAYLEQNARKKAC